MVIEKEKAHAVLRELALAEKIHLVNAMAEINESNFKLKVDEEYLDEVAGLCLIDSFSEKKDYKTIQEKLYKLMDYMGLERLLDLDLLHEDFDFEALQREINLIYDELSEIRERIKTLEEEKIILDQMRIMDGIYEDHIDFKKLYDLEYFKVKFGTLTKENMERLTKNYENIYAAILHIGKKGHNEIYLVISLKELEIETDRILRSVYFEEVPLLEDYLDTPKNMLDKLDERLMFINQEIEGLQLRANEYDQKYGDRLMVCYAQLMLELKIEQMKKQLAVTSNYVYISGWIAESDVEDVENLLGQHGDQIVYGYRDQNEVEKLATPTKLKNHWLFKPFENLVHMYGTPSYKEADPTIFVGLAYMFLFGAMFGDIGQGMLLFLAGFLVAKKHSDYGGILKRIGLTSIFFGFVYDSFFGYEHFISSFFSESLEKKLFIRPIENINLMLIFGVVVGLMFLAISYGYSIYNKLKQHDLKEGLFGRNGIVGVILFASVLLLVAESFLGLALPGTLLKIIIALCIVLMIIREPLANTILRHKPLYHETVSEYYVESGFELIETFLGMLSNTLSFIRVGAFALNHVGLFMAFHTIAHLIGSLAGEIGMFIVGNALVIALEGLIVLIQGLRLVYYEMFSKYYAGDGILFTPTYVENLGGE